MIGYLCGKIKFIFAEEIILDVQGVGYKIFIDAETRQNLQIDTEIELFIHTLVREDAINLFGFKNRQAFELFETLLTVNGIGAKSALSIVSKISATDFALAVANQNLTALTKLPGVGKKSAQRILLELKDKIGNFSKDLPAEENFQPITISNAAEEAEEALSALGYTQSEISAVFNRAPKNSTTENLIKFALKELNKFA